MNLKKVKSRLKDEKLDLSLCDLKEVPIREIVRSKTYTYIFYLIWQMSDKLLNLIHIFYLITLYRFTL